MRKIQAIPTKYGDIQFKSRLEARWAVFMDALGVEWKYEYEGFQLPSGWYLPDFYLPKWNAWLEIKPYPLEQDDFRRCRQLLTELSLETNQVVFLLNNPLPEIEWKIPLAFTRGCLLNKTKEEQDALSKMLDAQIPDQRGRWGLHFYPKQPYVYGQGYIQFGFCGECEQPTLGQYGSHLLDCDEPWEHKTECPSREHWNDHPRVLNAYNKASNYQFAY